MNSGSDDRSGLRQRLKRLRRAVPPAERRAASLSVAQHVRRTFHLRPGMRIAVYAPLASELDCGPVVELARRHRCRIFLPRLTDLRRRRMRFVEAAGPMRRNHLGILEPIHLRHLAARSLDLVFVPLVGFDAKGERLGMGAGYYDRAFHFLRHRHHWRHPRLIGLAYSFQQVPFIQGAAHDVRMSAVITEKGLIACSSGS